MSRGRRCVLSDVGFAVEAGAGIQLAGANGSGKTSLLRVLAGLTHPRRGSLLRHGACAFVPERVTLAPALRCGEWLSAMRDLRGLEPVDWAAVLVASGLDAAVHARPASVLSKGMLQRVALVEALQSDVALLLLDEPFSGLDVDGRRWLGERVSGCQARGAAVLFSDHSGVAGGRLRLTEILRLRDGACEREPAPAHAAGASLLNVIATHPDGRRLERAVPDHASDELLRDLLRDGWHVEQVGP